MRTFLLGIRNKYVPVGSRRERVYHLIRLMLYNWKRQGFVAALVNVNQRARFYLSKELALTRSGYSYQQWIYDHEPDSKALEKQRAEVEHFIEKPLISIITPVYNPSPEVLKDTINSVRRQTYPYWELCLANGASTQAGVREVLDEAARFDERILVKHLPENLGISLNSNAALGMSSGKYIALMDHDDLIASDMLYEVVKTINQHPDAEIIYFDEDKVSADGRHRLDPFFKPENWSPDLLLSTNYLMHSVILRSLIEKQDGFNPEVDGAQDWDLSLRIANKERKIYHIPRVFYHWRQVPGSAAREANAKPWAFAAQARCIEQHLKSIHAPGARVDFPDLGRVRIEWAHTNPRVSIIIPSKDKVDLLQGCLESILEQTTYDNFEILIIDTGSREAETFKYLEEITKHPKVSLHVYPDRFNYQKVNNFGARIAEGDLLLFLNNDTEVIGPSWLDDLVGWAERPGVGVVGTKLLYPNGTIQHGGIVMGVEGHGSHIFERLPEHHYGPFGSPDWYRDYQAVTGACMMVPSAVFDELGGFDETYQVGYGDIDLCLRAGLAGYRVVYSPFATLIHHEGGTRGYSLPASDVLRASFLMYDKVKAGDPYFNPNLSYLYRQPTVADPREPPREERILRILHDFGLIDTTALEMNPVAGDSLAGEQETIQAMNSPGKKLLIISHELSLTGAPLTLADLARYLSAHGFGITVLSPIEGPLEEKFGEIGAEVIINPMILRDARELLRYITSCDLLLANTILAWRAIYTAKAIAKPSIWWIHESQFGLDYAAQYPRVEGAFQAADVIGFPTSATSDLYTSFTDGTRVEVLRPGLDTSKLSPNYPLTSGEGNGKRMRLINVASYEPRKGQDILVKSLDQLPEGYEIDCYLIGRKLDWWFSQKLFFLANRRQNIHILGELPNEKVLEHMRSADVFVLPSRDEALPMTLLEAMYYSKAIIASRSGGIPEIIEHGENGLIFEVEDYQQLSDHIKRLYDDRNYRHQIGMKGNEKLTTELTFEVQGKKWMEIINHLLETNKG
ncbi:MAG: glycosyltransferase [Anaerolineales bacterium]